MLEQVVTLFLLLASLLHRCVVYPVVLWFEDVCLDFFEELFRALTRQTFSEVQRFLNGFVMFFLSFFNYGYRDELRETWDRRSAWQRSWERGVERPSALNFLVADWHPAEQAAAEQAGSSPVGSEPRQDESDSKVPTQLTGFRRITSMAVFPSFSSFIPSRRRPEKEGNRFRKVRSYPNVRSAQGSGSLAERRAASTAVLSREHAQNEHSDMFVQQSGMGVVSQRRGLLEDAKIAAEFAIVRLFSTLRACIRRVFLIPHRTMGATLSARSSSRTADSARHLDLQLSPGPRRVKARQSLDVAAPSKRSGDMSDSQKCHRPRLLRSRSAHIIMTDIIGDSSPQASPITPGLTPNSVNPGGRHGGGLHTVRRVHSSGNLESLHHRREGVLSASEVIRMAGYPLEVHTVTTQDGYILTMERIPRPGCKDVVFFMHGVLDTSMGWISAGVTGSQAFTAWEAGFDVWLGNTRSNPPCLHQDPEVQSGMAYWKFTVNDLALADTSSQLDRIHDVKCNELGAGEVSIDVTSRMGPLAKSIFGRQNSGAANGGAAHTTPVRHVSSSPVAGSTILSLTPSSDRLKGSGRSTTPASNGESSTTSSSTRLCLPSEAQQNAPSAGLSGKLLPCNSLHDEATRKLLPRHALPDEAARKLLPHHGLPAEAARKLLPRHGLPGEAARKLLPRHVLPDEAARKLLPRHDLPDGVAVEGTNGHHARQQVIERESTLPALSEGEHVASSMRDPVSCPLVTADRQNHELVRMRSSNSDGSLYPMLGKTPSNSGQPDEPDVDAWPPSLLAKQVTLHVSPAHGSDVGKAKTFTLSAYSGLSFPNPPPSSPASSASCSRGGRRVRKSSSSMTMNGHASGELPRAAPPSPSLSTKSAPFSPVMPRLSTTVSSHPFCQPSGYSNGLFKRGNSHGDMVSLSMGASNASANSPRPCSTLPPVDMGTRRGSMGGLARPCVTMPPGGGGVAAGGPLWMSETDAAATAAGEPYRLRAVGHSLGGMALLIHTVMRAKAGRPSHVHRLVLLTPAGFHIDYPRALVPFVWFLPQILWFIHIFWPSFAMPFFIPTVVARLVVFKLFADVRAIPSIAELQRLMICFMLNADSSQWDRAVQLPHYSEVSMPAMALHMMLHVTQLARCHRFHLFDYGSAAENAAHYDGETVPPDVADEYWRLRECGIPVDLVAGKRDGIITPKNVQCHLKKLQEAGVTVSYREFDFGHLDFTFAVKEDLKLYFMRLLRK